MKKLASAALSASLIASLALPSMAGAKNAFKDVKEDFWAKDSIEFLAGEGIITGYPDGSFRPNEPVKRSQAAIMIAGALDLESSEDPGFEDVGEGDSTYEAAAAVAEAGIIEGKDDKFMPNQPLTRGQMAKVLTLAYDFSGEAEEDFADVNEDHWAYEYISALSANDIATGYEEDQTFRPNQPTTRAQFSTFMKNSIDVPSESPEPERDEEIVQLLQDTMDAQLALDTYTFDGSMDIMMKFPVPEDISEEEQEMIDESSEMTMDLSGTYQKDPLITEAVIEQEIPGFDETMVMPSIMSEDKSYEYITDAAFMGYPEEWQDKYIEYDFEEMFGEDAGSLYDVEQQQEMMQEVYDVLLDHFGTEYFELHDSHASVPADITYEHILSFELTNEDLEELTSVFEESVWPELETILANPQLASTLGLSAQEAQKLNEEADADFDEFLSNLNLENFEIYQAIDEDNYVVFDTGNIAVNYTDEEETISFGINYEFSMSDFNEDVSFEYGLPENEDEIISFDEVMEWQEEQLEGIEDFEEIEEMEEIDEVEDIEEEQE
ncbi:S-layer homology domain-containing protein [Alteribacillus bidgolensis]|uniref:S-layer homology domain-containing protein n=1 Tax=Alteribacillus bidgolensis TaxID=930129 RepID=A0A1G8M569_9BACI|nr:S-layer homology domain-containing protein [Alteribacillus bidgolensis]SDI63099.1 S-layer homology domain-containing protein [Alteribacillus bidgolensis]